MATIYALECSVNGFAYVGCTAGKIGKRLREHRCMLNKKNHSSVRMTEDWHRYGGDAFTMKVLQTLPEAVSLPEKRDAELSWMRRYDALGLLYNLVMVSFNPPPGSLEKAIEASRRSIGNRWSPETNLRRSLAQKGKPKGHGAKISETKRKNRLMMLSQVMR